MNKPMFEIIGKFHEDMWLRIFEEVNNGLSEKLNSRIRYYLLDLAIYRARMTVWAKTGYYQNGIDGEDI